MFLIFLIMRNENLTKVITESNTIDKCRFLSITIDGNLGNNNNRSNHKST